MLGTIYVSNGKKLQIDHFMIAPEKYIKGLPKAWNVEGLLYTFNNIVQMAVPPENTKYIFLNALDRGCTFKLDYTPKTILVRRLSN